MSTRRSASPRPTKTPISGTTDRARIRELSVKAELIDDEPADPTRPRRATKLEAFLRSRGIKPARLARESGYSRQHLLRIRMGKMEPTRRCIAAIVVACRRITRRKARPSDLFDLGDAL